MATLNLTKDKEWWRRTQAMRGIAQGMLWAWLSCRRREKLNVGSGLWRLGITCVGSKLYVNLGFRLVGGGKLKNNGTIGSRIRQTRFLCGRMYAGWLVLSKHAPKWVRNWAKRQGEVIETWQPLSLEVCRECVQFEKMVRKAERVVEALRQ